MAKIPQKPITLVQVTNERQYYVMVGDSIIHDARNFSADMHRPEYEGRVSDRHRYYSIPKVEVSVSFDTADFKIVMVDDLSQLEGPMWWRRIKKKWKQTGSDFPNVTKQEAKPILR